MTGLERRLSGRFIVIDGPDGAGKTTQLARLKEHLERLGLQVQMVRDPGGTQVGDRIRAILLDRGSSMDAMTEMLLFMASRAQLVRERVFPAMREGKVVLCDRFITATVAYQGAAGVDRDQILHVGNLAVDGIWPDLTIILDLPPEVGLARVAAARGAGDRMEAKGLEFHRAVRELFRRVGDDFPAPVVHVPADRPPDEVFADVLAALRRVFGKMPVDEGL